MPEKNIQNKINQEKTYQILSKGVVLTMEDDLKDVMQKQKMKADLIPGYEKKEVGNQAVFAEKVYFDPFKNFEKTVKDQELKPVIEEKKSLEPIQKPTAPQTIEPQSTEQLLQKRREIYDKIKTQKANLDNLFQKIEAIKEQKNQIEKQEQSAIDALQKHNLEEQRWQIEEKFKQAQDLQWAQEEEIEKSQMVLSKIDNDSREFLAIIQEEQKIEEQAKNIEKQIQAETDTHERKKLEQERREIAQKRQIQEKKRWEAEKRPIEAQLGEKEIIQQIRLNAKEREQELIEKQVVQKQVSQEKQATNEEFKQKEEEENRQEAIEKLKQIAEQEQKKSFLGKLKGPFLKEEILKKLTKVSPEEEAQRKDFLSRISQRTKPLPRQKSKGFEQGVVFHPMIKKISLFEKISIRVLIILLIIGVGVGVYFGITKLMKKENINPLPFNNVATTTENPIENWPSIFPNSTTTIATTTEQPATIAVIATTTTVILPPLSLILVSKNNIFSYQEDFQTIVSSTLAALKNKIQYNFFEQISVFDENQQVFLNAMQFFAMIGAALPQEINQENGTSTILVFSSKFGNRLGFVLQTENTANLKNAFSLWENQAEVSTASIFDLMGKISPALKKTFANLKYKTTSIRCQTFTKSDLGICYGVYRNYFIWTSSFEQMARVVDKLP